tara:strand:- start:452 stop:781 length:330 start_codon:yes stop_codon:yes gene_type:complete
MSETKRFIFIEGDYNDADYITEETEIAGEFLERLDVIKQIAIAVKNNPNRNNWNVTKLSQYRIQEQYPQFENDDLELFDQLVPMYEGVYGVHTIKRIEIREIRVVERLL